MLLVYLTSTVPEGRVFGLDQQMLIQIGIQLLNAIILAVVLAKLLYEPVKSFMRKRTERIQDSINRANDRQSEAEALIGEYDAKLAEIEQERHGILEAARERALEDREEILAEALLEAEEIRQKNRELIAQDESRLNEEVRLHAIDLSTIIAARYLSEEMDDEERAAYVERITSQLEDAQWPR